MRIASSSSSRSWTSSCCSSGTTNEKGNDATHLNLPSGIAILHNGNMIVTDGYGNNRVILFDKTGKFIKQVGKGAGGPEDKGTGPGEWNLPHKLAVDADENLYIIDREGHRLEVFDKNLNYIREIRNDWNPWDVNISRKGTDGIGWIADHKDERVLKFSVEGRKDPRGVGQAGLGPRRVRLGPRHRRRLEGRGVRRRHLRAAAAEVRAVSRFVGAARENTESATEATKTHETTNTSDSSAFVSSCLSWRILDRRAAAATAPAHRESPTVALDHGALKLAADIDRAAPGVAADFLDQHAAVGAADGQRIRIDHQPVVPAQRVRVGRQTAAQAMAAQRVGASGGRRMILDRRRPDLVAVDPEHDAVGEAARETTRAAASARRIVGDVERRTSRRARTRAGPACARDRARTPASRAPERRHERIERRTRRARRDTVLSLRAPRVLRSLVGRHWRYHTRHDTLAVLRLLLALQAAPAPQKVEIVSVTGCLKETAPNTWTLVNATDPVPSSANAPPAEGNPDRAAGRQERVPADRRLRVQPAGAQGPTVIIKGLFIKATPDEPPQHHVGDHGRAVLRAGRRNRLHRK